MSFCGESVLSLINNSVPRLLIIGAAGFLGSHALRECVGQFDVLASSHRGDAGSGVLALDISDAGSVKQVLHEVRPDLVLLLAAISDIDRCEALPELANNVNARGPEIVANACAQCNARLLFTSSAAVFDGAKEGYREDDVRNPLSIYGKSKAAAEDAVLSLLPDSAVILRPALVLGFGSRPGTNALLDRLFEKWRVGQSIAFPTRESRNPIDATTLGKVMLNLLKNSSVHGVYHVGSSDALSRFQLGQRLAQRAGVSADLVRPADQHMPGRAPRGEHHFLLTDKIRDQFHWDLGTSDAVIERCFS